jgi:VanZ family protein
LIDKWIHIGLFLVLVFFWSWAFSGKQIGKGKQKTIFFKITLLSLIYGIIMEIVQRYFIPFRSFNYGDIAANGVGCFIGYIIAIRKYIKK